MRLGVVCQTDQHGACLSAGSASLRGEDVSTAVEQAGFIAEQHVIQRPFANAVQILNVVAARLTAVCDVRIEAPEIPGHDAGHLLARDVLVRTECAVLETVDHAGLNRPLHVLGVVARRINIGEGAAGILREIRAAESAEHGDEHRARQRDLRAESMILIAVDPTRRDCGVNGFTCPVIAVVGQDDGSVRLGAVFFLQPVVIHDAQRVGHADRRDLLVGAQKLAAFAVVTDEAVLDQNGGELFLQAVIDDAVVVRDRAVRVRAVGGVALYQTAVAGVMRRDAQSVQVHENVACNGIFLLGDLRQVVAVRYEDARALCGVFRFRGVQMQAHEQIGGIFHCELHALIDIAGRGGILAAGGVCARHAHDYVFVGLQLRLHRVGDLQRNVGLGIGLAVHDVLRAAVHAAVSGVERDEKPVAGRERLR